MKIFEDDRAKSRQFQAQRLQAIKKDDQAGSIGPSLAKTWIKPVHIIFRIMNHIKARLYDLLGFAKYLT